MDARAMDGRHIPEAQAQQGTQGPPASLPVAVPSAECRGSVSETVPRERVDATARRAMRTGSLCRRRRLSRSLRHHGVDTDQLGVLTCGSRVDPAACAENASSPWARAGTAPAKPRTDDTHDCHTGRREEGVTATGEDAPAHGCDGTDSAGVGPDQRRAKRVSNSGKNNGAKPGGSNGSNGRFKNAARRIRAQVDRRESSEAIPRRRMHARHASTLRPSAVEQITTLRVTSGIKGSAGNNQAVVSTLLMRAAVISTNAPSVM